VSGGTPATPRIHTPRETLTELLAALAGVLGLLIVCVGAILVALIVVWRPHGRMGRAIFYAGTIGLPLAVLAARAADELSILPTFFISLLAIFATTLGFPAIGLRHVGVWPAAHRRRLRTDTVLYLIASVLWFSALYWTATSAAIEGLHFAVAAPFADAVPPRCLSDARFICTPLTFVQALEFSAGNLLTLGAAGITPLDDAARLFALLQLLPVFTSVYVLVRN